MSYMAPELVNTMPYQAQVVDLFALGIILFNMFTCQRPFTVANDEDDWYRYICEGRMDLFWKKHEQDFAKGFSHEFKDLISCMLHVNPQNRLCMADIVGHNWMKGETATFDEIQIEFNQRLAILKKSNAISKEQQAQAINYNMNADMGIRRNVLTVNNINYTANDLNKDEIKAGNYVKLDVKTCREVPNKSTLTFGDENPAVIFKAIAEELAKEEINVDIAKTRWRLTYTQQMPYTCLEKIKKKNESAQ